jgi:hypothetical protein
MEVDTVNIDSETPVTIKDCDDLSGNSHGH